MKYIIFSLFFALFSIGIHAQSHHGTITRKSINTTKINTKTAKGIIHKHANKSSNNNGIKDANYMTTTIKNPIITYRMDGNAESMDRDDGLKIESISRSTYNVIIKVTYKSAQFGEWINIRPDTYIKANGKKYPLTQIEGIAINPNKTYLHTGEIKSFTLYFPQIPKTVSSIDLVEPGNSSWKFYGIQLSDNQKINTSKNEVINNIAKNIVNNMILIEGGTFVMGATKEQGSHFYYSEKPSHRVSLSSFKLCKYEVTQKEWVLIMGDNPSTDYIDENHPVDHVSWNECQRFIKKLNSITGYNFRMPTEAEWEYAARGGKHSKGYKYPGGYNLNRYGWYSENKTESTHRVGIKEPNELGLYDMGGNVWEWCQDWLGGYSSAYTNNPKGPVDGTFKIMRGGCWDSPETSCRVSFRGNQQPSSNYGSYGLRLAM